MKLKSLQTTKQSFEVKILKQIILLNTNIILTLISIFPILAFHIPNN